MKNIAIIGSGTMGNGIAHAFAQHNFSVCIIDISQDALDNALLTITKNLDRQLKKDVITEENKESALSNIVTSTNLETGVQHADLVIEAATEKTDIKLDLFRQLDDACPENCILATNTSSISITQIASATQRPDKVIGMHFMNPVPLMKLVEVIRGYSTSDTTTKAILELSLSIEK